jgi:hypothetical protein
MDVAKGQRIAELRREIERMTGDRAHSRARQDLSLQGKHPGIGTEPTTKGD